MKRFAIIFAFVAMLVGVSATSGSAASFNDSTPCPATLAILVCPIGYVGEPYTLQLIGQAGCDLYRWEIPNGQLPKGLTMNSTGLVTGVPESTADEIPWMTIHDLLPAQGGYPWCGGDNQSQRQFEFKVVPGLSIQTQSVPPGTVNQPYSATLSVYTVTNTKPFAGSPTTATWSIKSGSLPTGVSLSTSGVISGTPTSEGSYAVVVKAVGGGGVTDTETEVLSVRQPLAVNSQLTTNGRRLEVGVPYTATQTATGGSGTYAWTLASGTLPTGVELKPDGSVAGTPTVPGTYTFAVKLADSEGRTQTLNTTLVVASPLAVSHSKLKSAKANHGYRQRIAWTGGVAPLQWRLVSGKLPKGVTLAKRLGLLLGKPTKAGTYRFEVEAADSFDVTSAARLTLVVKK